MEPATAWGALAVIVLAGGAGRRVGGRDKPILTVGGVPMLERVLAAVDGVASRIVVGPPRSGLPADVVTVREDPPGGGPAAALTAGLSVIGSTNAPATSTAGSNAASAASELVAVLAGDLPHLSEGAVRRLIEGVHDNDGALFVDDTGKRQLLCGVWRTEVLRRAVRRQPDAGKGLSMRAVLEGLRVAEVRWVGAGPPPYFDCDTETDLRLAEGH